VPRYGRTTELLKASDSSREGERVILGGMGIQTVFPEGIESVAQKEGAKVEHAGGSGFRPKHAGLFEALTDHVFAPGFNDSAANEPALLSIEAVAHA